MELSWSRVYAILWRHLYYFKRNLDRLSDSFYWPVMDLVLWGLTTVWLQSSAPNGANLVMVMLTAVVFWQIVWRANYEISVNLLEEMWTKNVVNLFSTPLRVTEWVAGVMLVGILKICLAVITGVLASWLLYSLNILSVGYLLLPFLISLILFGWSLGFMASGLIMRFGRNIQTVAWMFGFLFAPLSAVYYPVSALPVWLQPLSYAIPATYIFEGMRAVIGTGSMDVSLLALSFVLNLVYLSLALLFFLRMFEYRRAQGLQGLEG